MTKNIIALFDLDGTLIDSTDAIVESFGAAYERFELPPPPQREIIKMIGLPLPDMFKRLGALDSAIDSFTAAYKERYREICLAKTALLPNAKEALLELRGAAKIAIVTTKTASFSAKIVEHLGIGEFISAIVGFEDVRNPKPHAEPILLALERLGAKADLANGAGKGKVFMIGDTALDIEAAINAGVTPIALLCGYSSKEDFARFNCEICDDALDAARLIMKTAL